MGIRAAPGDLQDSLFDAADARLLQAHHLRAPAGALGIAGVHAQQVSRKKRRLFPADARTDLKHDVFFIVRIFWQKKPSNAVFRPFDRPVRLRKFFARKFAKRRVLFFV